VWLCKIRFCREQVHRDGLQYFWIDTCGINKTERDDGTMVGYNYSADRPMKVEVEGVLSHPMAVIRIAYV
jgi:hypothetical protein